ncbi:MAG: purine-binding chemotaxis protein CheW [Desulfovibrionaceae bacterium]|nr:purine-binding chemotaxis protein CheW [Desulfovibrionaceae bacterium]MBF0514081.1 purine-binding chemotaxis protein CheW [Desulfovibrionaceae bacterium]
MTNLEEYFKTAVVTPEESAAPLRASESEQAFMEKYLGLDWKSRLAGSRLDKPSKVESVAGFAPESADSPGDPAATPDEDEDEALEQGLAQAKQLQLVGFYVGEEMFGVPMQFVSEVIRMPQPTKLPAAPPFLSGIVNLRGRVTPLIDLGVLLGIGQGEPQASRFVIVCRFRGLRLGMQVRAIAAMHRASGADAQWNVEQQTGTGAAYLAGLLKTGEKLIRIVSVSRLFHKVMKA